MCKIRIPNCKISFIKFEYYLSANIALPQPNDIVWIKIENQFKHTSFGEVLGLNAYKILVYAVKKFGNVPYLQWSNVSQWDNFGILHRAHNQTNNLFLPPVTKTSENIVTT